MKKPLSETYRRARKSSGNRREPKEERTLTGPERTEVQKEHRSRKSTGPEKAAMVLSARWSAEAKGIMVVDFERAKLVERKMTKRTALGSISGNQRSRQRP